MPPKPSAPDLEKALLSAMRQFFEASAPEGATKPALVEEKEPEPSDAVTGRRLQLATAILFQQMIAADQGAKPEEHQAMLAAVGRVLGIDLGDAAIIISLGEKHVKTPLPQLLGLLKERCTLIQKKKVIESMWQLAFADAELAGHEEYFVRKVSRSLGLSTADLVETKILAREGFLAQG